MTVYLVVRSHYEGPAVLSPVRRFEDDSVLAWFQRRWDGEGAGDGDYFDNYFDDFVEEARNEGVARPRNHAEMRATLEEHLYAEGDILYRPHCLQVLHDDDELEFAFYLFDGAYLQKNAVKAAFLLHDDWRLPEGAADEGARAKAPTLRLKAAGPGQGATYLAFLTYYDSANLSDLGEPEAGGCRIEGARLPELIGYLTSATRRADWPFELMLLRSRATGVTDVGALLGRAATLSPLELLERAGDLCLREGVEVQGTKLEQALDVALSELPLAPPDQNGASPNLSQVQAAPHVAQLSLHIDTWESRGKPRHLFHRWVLFDDLWLAAHRDLGEAILRHARRWDVLT